LFSIRITNFNHKTWTSERYPNSKKNQSCRKNNWKIIKKKQNSLSYTKFFFFFFGFCTGFRPVKGGRLIRLVRRGMWTGQALFLLGIEPGIPWVCPWKELLATGAQATWLHIHRYLWEWRWRFRVMDEGFLLRNLDNKGNFSTINKF